MFQEIKAKISKKDDKNKNIIIQKSQYFIIKGEQKIKEEIFINQKDNINNNLFQNQVNLQNNQINPYNNFNLLNTMNNNMMNGNNINYNMMNNINNSNNNMIFNHMNNNLNYNMMNNSFDSNMIFNNNMNNNNLMINNNMNMNFANNNINNNLQTGNQMNMINFSENNNQINNDNLSNELKKGGGPKLNVQFEKFGANINIVANVGITVHQLLKHYLKRIGKPELERNNTQLRFKHNYEILKFNDQTPIEKFFKYRLGSPNSYKITVLVPGDFQKEVIFKTSSGIQDRIYIKLEATVEQCLQEYLKGVSKKELIEKKGEINFIDKGNIIKSDEKEIVGNYFKEYEPIIMVLDPNNLIS